MKEQPNPRVCARTDSMARPSDEDRQPLPLARYWRDTLDGVCIDAHSRLGAVRWAGREPRKASDR